MASCVEVECCRCGRTRKVGILDIVFLEIELELHLVKDRDCRMTLLMMEELNDGYSTNE